LPVLAAVVVVVSGLGLVPLLHMVLLLLIQAYNYYMYVCRCQTRHTLSVTWVSRPATTTTALTTYALSARFHVTFSQSLRLHSSFFIVITSLLFQCCLEVLLFLEVSAAAAAAEVRRVGR